MSKNFRNRIEIYISGREVRGGYVAEVVDSQTWQISEVPRGLPSMFDRAQAILGLRIDENPRAVLHLGYLPEDVDCRVREWHISSLAVLALLDQPRAPL